ncbi:hypothetical protein [Fibrella arboris]|uniref:hypothetical protein n=1 Tax=Fibrella arboris TaxID=3242486 RepID=UPI0035224014
MPFAENDMKRVDLLYFDAASGHRSAAAGLQSALQAGYPHWPVRMVNIVDIFDHHPRMGPLVRRGIDRFNRQLQKDKVFDLSGQINLSLLFHDLLGEKGRTQLARFWGNTPPDVVVSVTPMYNPALFRSVRLLNPAAVCITIPVDFDEAKPRYWFTPKVPQYYLNATDRLYDQARALGIPDSHNLRISGMPVDPACYQLPPTDRADTLRKLGLDPALPTGFVSFGGQGCSLLTDIAEAVAEAKLAVNLLFMCGRNEAVREAISGLPTPYPKAVMGYTSETPIHYLRLANFAIGKPGAMTLTEAMLTHTPLIALKSRGMRLVQRGNEDWLLNKQVGLVVNGPRQVASAIKQVVVSPEYRQRAAKQSHRGVFEAVTQIGQLANQLAISPRRPAVESGNTL